MRNIKNMFLINIESLIKYYSKTIFFKYLKNSIRNYLKKFIVDFQIIILIYEEL